MEQIRALYDYDSLPYIDNEVDHPAVAAAVQQLIEAEMATFRPDPEEYLKGYPYPKLSPRLEAMIREQESRGGEALKKGVDLSRYTMETPAAPSSSAMSSDKQFPFSESCGAWHQAVNRGKSMVEYQENRLQHLELQLQHTAPLWLKHIEHIESGVAMLENQIKTVEADCNAVNYERKREQESCGSDMAISWRKRDAAIAGQSALQQAIAAKKSKS